MEVAARGKHGRHLRVKGWMLSKTVAYRWLIKDHELAHRATEMGFTKLSATSYLGGGSTTPTPVVDDASVATDFIRRLGLDKPLKLKKPPKANR